MRERPILFNGDMVRAILSGRKTQTRRVVKLPAAPASLGRWEPGMISADAAHSSTGVAIPHQACIWHTRTGKSLICPLGQPGDRLWVRETWGFLGTRFSLPANTHHAFALYHADGLQREIPFATRDAMDRAVPAQVIKYPANFGDMDEDEQRSVEGDLLVAWWRRKKKIPAIHMPRWACRLVLEITRVRVERLRDISYEDALAEGAEDGAAFCESLQPGHLNAAGETHEQLARRLHWPQRRFERIWNSTGGDWSLNPRVWVIEFQRAPCANNLSPGDSP